MRFQAIFVIFAAIMAFVLGDQLAQGNVNKNTYNHPDDNEMKLDSMTDKTMVTTVTVHETIVMGNGNIVTVHDCTGTPTVSVAPATISSLVASFSMSTVKTSVVMSTGTLIVPGVSVSTTPGSVATPTVTSSITITLMSSSLVSSTSETVNSATISTTPATTATPTTGTPTAKHPTSSAPVSTGAAVANGVQAGGSVFAGIAAIMFAMA